MKTKLDEARELALAHREADPATSVVKFFHSEHSDPIRLLEVSDSAPTTGEIMPFTFAANRRCGVIHDSTVILLSPDDWAAVQAGKLSLPTDWDISTAKDL